MRWSIVDGKLEPTLQRQPADNGNVEFTFAPQDRIVQLTMRHLDIADTRKKRAAYAPVGRLAPGTSGLPRPDPPDPAR